MCGNVKYGIWNVNEPDAGSVNALVRAGYAPLAAMVLASRGSEIPRIFRKNIISYRETKCP